MSEQKKYIFTSDCTNLAGALLFSEGDIITVGASPYGSMLTDQEHRNLIESGVLIDYPEPSMVSDDLTGVELKIACDKVEALEKELNESNKALISLTKLYCYQSIKLEELKNDRDLNTAGTHVDPSAFEPGGFMNQPSEKIKDTATNATNNPAKT